MSTKSTYPLRIASVALLLLCTVAARAQDVQFDTLTTRPVGPGVVHTYIEAPSIPWTIHVLEIDLTNPLLEIETAKANNLLEGGHERTSSMAARHDAPGHRIVGGVNGDFYAGAARPINTQILNGEILQPAAQGRTVVGFDVDDRPMMEIVRVGGTLLLADTSASIAGVNKTRATDQLVLFNQYWGSTTQTNQFGTEVQVRPLEPWLANDTLTVVVEAKAAGTGSMSIPDGEAVLSGHGVSSTLLNTRVAVGDTIRLYLSVQPGLSRLQEMMGGHPFLVRNGVSDVGPRGDAADRHPRTGVGFSADSTTLYLVTVDGRQPTSDGMTLPELAYFMTLIGVETGMNLDGGGSTTMLVRGEVVNSPSDGRERTVANALFVATSAPEGPLSRIFVDPGQVRLFMGHSAAFSVAGADEHYKPLPVDTSLLEFTVDPRLGIISEDGRFRAGWQADTGFVYVRYGDLLDSARVIVKTVADFTLSPSGIITDTTRTITFTTRSFDQDGLEQTVPPDSFVWRSSDPTVGIFEAPGRFRGVGPGLTRITAEHRGIIKEATITVELHRGGALVSGFEDLDAWTLGGNNVDLTTTTHSLNQGEKVEGTASLQIDYTFTYDPQVLNEVYLDTDISIAGVPDSLYLHAKSDGKRHRIFYEVEDALGRTFDLFAAAYADSENDFKLQPGSFDRAQPASGAWTLQYPVRLKRIILRLASDRVAGQTFSGRILLDNLRITYPAKTTSAEELPERSGGPRLLGNYPNPFVQSTTISFELDRTEEVRISVYDVLGREVYTFAQGVRPAGPHEIRVQNLNLPSGQYFYRLATPTKSLVGKMMVIQ